MPFRATGPHHCPVCSEDPAFLKAAQALRTSLEPDGARHRALQRALEAIELMLVRENYSGTGADAAGCPNCKKVFAVSYGVAAVEEIPWGEAGYVV